MLKMLEEERSNYKSYSPSLVEERLELAVLVASKVYQVVGILVGVADSELGVAEELVVVVARMV